MRVSLRRKTFISLGLALAGLVLIVVIVSQYALLEIFRKLEIREATIDSSRVKNALSQMVKQLDDQASDWSDWDDTFFFAKDRNKEYIESNLSTLTLPVSSIVYADAKGKAYFSKGVDGPHEWPEPNAPALTRALRLAAQGEPIVTTGLIDIDGRPLMFTSRPILKTDKSGPARGWIIFTRWLDKSIADEIANTSQYDVSYKTLSPTASQELMEGNTVVTVLSPTILQCSEVIRNTFGEPFLVQQTRIQRTLYQTGLVALRFLVIYLVLSSLVFALTILASFDRLTLMRIKRLTDQVANLDEEDTTERAITLDGSDELTSLADTMNDMVLDLRSKNFLLSQRNQVLENAVEGIAHVSEDGRLETVNQAFASILGQSPAELHDAPATDFVPSESLAEHASALEALLRDGKAEFTFSFTHNGHQIVHVESTLVQDHRDTGTVGPYTWFLKDVTERIDLSGQIQYQAFHDPLTGLPNRQLFHDRLSQELRRCSRSGTKAAVMFIDLDNFKVINDSLGHRAGDQVLIAVRDVLTRCVRLGDTVARLGGDEFTILVTDLSDVSQAQALAERILKELQMPVVGEFGQIVISASIGIAADFDSNYDPEDLLRDADIAMYAAKTAGKNLVRSFDLSMKDAAVMRMELESELRLALLDNALAMDLQPVIDLATNKVTGVESLIRWHSPRLGTVAPDVFVPVAEEAGLIDAIGAWILRETCSHYAEIEALFGENLTIGVNVSARQLENPEFVDVVKSALRDSGVDPTNLTLEITETLFMQDQARMAEVLQQIRNLGVRVAMDDFGTGYSSLATIVTCPIDTVKVDKAFVAEIKDSHKSRCVLASIVDLCRTLDFKIVAEGIEDIDQLELVRTLGCTHAQGYLLGRPMTMEKLREWILTADRAETSAA